MLDHGQLNTVAFSPDGKWIAYENDSARRGVAGLYVVRPDGGGRHRVLAGSILSYTWSPDGAMLAVTRGLNDVTLVDSDGRVSRRLRLRGPRFILNRLSWSPDGRYIAFDDDNPNGVEDDVWIVGADGHGVQPLMRGVHNVVAGWTAAAPSRPC